MPLQPIFKQKLMIQYFVVNQFYIIFCPFNLTENLDSVTVFKGSTDLYFGFDLLYLLRLELITMREQQITVETNHFAIMIRVIKIQSIRSRKRVEHFSLKIQHMMALQGYNIPFTSRNTHTISKNNAIWLEDVYYNNCDMHSVFQFTMLCQEGAKFEPVLLQGSKVISNFRQKDQMDRQTVNMSFRGENGSQIVVQIQLNVFSNEDFMGGLTVPQISLANLKQKSQRPQFSAIDIMKPPIFNCFSCMDGQIHGFDKLECFPTKFKTKNKVLPMQ